MFCIHREMIFTSLFPETYFTVINRAGENVTIVDKSGAWSMDFPPAEGTDMLPQVAISLKKQAVFKASSAGSGKKEGKPLLINGEKEFAVEAGKAPTTSFVVHKEGSFI